MNVLIISDKIKALDKFIDTNEGKQLVKCYKRMIGMLKGRDIKFIPDLCCSIVDYDSLVNRTNAEKNMFWLTMDCETDIDRLNWLNLPYEALNRLHEHTNVIDKFFDEVHIFDDNLEVRENNLNMIMYALNTFRKIGDFSLIK